MALQDERCVPCSEGGDTLALTDLALLREELPDWTVSEGHHLHRRISFDDFATALAWVNRAGRVCEEQGHHADFHLGWGYVEIDIYTHKLDGLTRADAVLAAKLDQLQPLDLPSAS
jgi:4a-hydroxytetrahydrobiopterin dehydratase